MLQKSFGPTFTNVSAAPEALVSYFKWLGGQPVGKEHSRLGSNGGFEPWQEPLQECLGLNHLFLIQYLLTVDLLLQTNSTIDS